jgi:hypothetical protein
MSESTPPVPTAAVNHPRESGAIWILILALLLGLLRFWRLGEWSFWGDEIYTIADWRFNLDRGKIWNPLGYLAIQWTAQRAGEGIDEFGVRLLPALCGWACIPLSWWAFRRCLGDRRAALVALLLAVSSWHIYWSQSARFYTMAMMVSLIGSGVILRGLWGDGRRRVLLGLAVVALAAAFHPTAAFVAFGLCLAPWLATFRGRDVPKGFRRGALAIGLLALVGGLLASGWLSGSLVNHLHQKGIDDLLAGPVHFLFTCGFFFTPLLCVAAVVGALWAWKVRDSRGILAVGVCLAGLGGALAISPFGKMSAQYAFCLLPWVLVVAVAPIQSLLERRDGRFLAGAWVILLTLPAAANSFLYLTARGGERPRWRDAYTWIDERRGPGDLIMGMGSPIGEFYLGGSDTDPRRARMVVPLDDWFPEGPRRWNRHARPIWVVIRPQWLEGMRARERERLEVWLAAECRMVKRFPVLMEGRDLELLVYRRD